jgi:hypothetical protein
MLRWVGVTGCGVGFDNVLRAHRHLCWLLQALLCVDVANIFVPLRRPPLCVSLPLHVSLVPPTLTLAWGRCLFST